MHVVVLSPARWRAFHVSKQLVSAAIANLGHSVLYVDPPLSPLSFIRHRDRLGDLRRTWDRPLDHVDVWTPRVLPGQNSAAGQAINARLLERVIRRRVPEPDLVISFALEARTVFGRLDGRRIYYCTDSFEDLPGAPADTVRGYERRLLESADVVVACSRPLQAQLAERGAHPVYLPHGCDLTAPAAPLPLPLPAELAGRPRPFAGYVGSVNFRIDAALLEAARHGLGGGTLVLVGSWWSSSGPRPDPETSRLLARDDVVTTGHRSLAELPAYLAALDVGLVPYHEIPFNRKSFPVKVPQYLAFGLPVISTPNGATDEYGELVTVASGAEQFQAAVAGALAGSHPEVRAGRKEAAARPWSTVARELLEVAGTPAR